MSWTVGSRIVAEPVGAKVHGASMAGGILLHLDVSFRLVGWPWAERGPISVIPQPSEVVAKLNGRELALGFATPAAASAFRPPDHASDQPVRLTLPLTTHALTSLEAARDGGPLRLAIMLVAHAVSLATYPNFPPGVDTSFLSVNYSFDVPRDVWVAILESVGYAEVLITELRLPPDGVESTALSRKRLAQAAKARHLGSYGEVMRHCRMAIDELRKLGFGGRGPVDVVRFLQDKAGTMSPVERISVLQTAAQLFLSPAHHANEPEDSYSREDADLSIAMTAALLRLWPMRVGEPPEEG